MSNSCDCMDGSPPGSSVHGISQAWILEWVAISSAARSSRPRDWTHIFCIGRSDLYQWATREAHYKTKPQPLEFLYTGFIYCFLMAQSNAGYRRRGASHPQSFRELGFLDDGDHDLEPWSPQLWTKWKGYTSLLPMSRYSRIWKWKWSCSVLSDSLRPYGL